MASFSRKAATLGRSRRLSKNLNATPKNFYIPTELGVSQEVVLRYHTARSSSSVSRAGFSTSLMRYFKAANLLFVASVLAVAACGLVIFVGGIVGVYAAGGVGRPRWE